MECVLKKLSQTRDIDHDAVVKTLWRACVPGESADAPGAFVYLLDRRRDVLARRDAQEYDLLRRNLPKWLRRARDFHRAAEIGVDEPDPQPLPSPLREIEALIKAIESDRWNPRSSPRRPGGIAKPWLIRARQSLHTANVPKNEAEDLLVAVGLAPTRKKGSGSV